MQNNKTMEKSTKSTKSLFFGSLFFGITNKTDNFLEDCPKKEKRCKKET